MLPIILFQNWKLYTRQLKSHPLITEHKEAATLINEKLNELAFALYNVDFYMQYCKQPFSVTGFLQHKLKYIQPRFNITCYASENAETKSDTSNAELYETLKRWRNIICKENDLPIYMVANQATLQEIATYLPLTKKDLKRISGFGKAKAEKYGDEILEAVESYCERNNLDTNMAVLPLKAGKEQTTIEKNATAKTDTKTISFNLYKEGKKISEIATERNLAVGTIESHLISFVAKGEIMILELVPADKRKLILDAAAKYGTLSHKTLIENLPSNITYNEIKMVLAAEKYAEFAPGN